MIRDTQRLKLYRAERMTRAFLAEPMDWYDTRAYVGRVTASKFWQEEFGHGVVVCDGRARTSAAAIGGHTITLPRWSRVPIIILHELAHIAIYRKQRYGVASHGREFAAMYLRLVRRFLGVETHDQLKAAFTANKVRFKPKHVIPPDRLEAMRERGRQLAAARRAA